MYRPYGPPLVWRSPSTPGSTPAVLVGLIVVIVIIVVLGGIFSMAWSGFGGMGAFLMFPVIMVVIIIVVVVAAVAAAAGGYGRRALPPPPPIQQPMVPAGMTGPIAMNCPNCGAPPASVDRFGVATCTHCATRFLVR